MTEYRKKPEVVEAIYFDGTNQSWEEVRNFTGLPINAVDLLGNFDYSSRFDKNRIMYLHSVTEHGVLYVYTNTWVIKQDDSIFQCTPAHFERTYEVIK